MSWAKAYPDYNVSLDLIPMDSSYKDFYNNETTKKYILRITKHLSHCLRYTNGKIKIYPEPELVFNSLVLTPLNQIRVVILGQDPYHQSGQAMGLAFSVPKSIKNPPSLKNIFSNLHKFNHIKEIPESGDLTSWAQQGILLLNTSLTVEDSCPNSHSKYWKDFTDSLIKYISDTLPNIVFVLFGSNALDKYSLIDKSKHNIIISSHPSPLSANNKLGSNPSFMNCDFFGEMNLYLQTKISI